ncbi:hypothetical protein H7H51_11130 [Mycolicibacterium farcinogenes]|nr:hypothetical protein [Mycolicibacterium farcinogenes]
MMFALDANIVCRLCQRNGRRSARYSRDGTRRSTRRDRGLAGSKELEVAEHDLMIGTLLLVGLIN